jgi:Zn-dependent protease
MEPRNPWLPATDPAAPSWSEPEEPAPGPGRPRPWWERGLGPTLAGLVAVIAKSRALTSVGSMAISLVGYSLLFGWEFAAGFVVLLFIHEMGHVIALRREGIKASWPTFIPFLGAVISARSLGENAFAEARIGLAGPILGSVGAFGCWLIWHLTGGADLWRALAFTGFLLNLFNLLPVVPLDGGRAMAAMSPWMWFIGFAAMVALAWFFPNPLVFLILLVAAAETWKRWQLRRLGGEDARAYYRVRPRDRAVVAIVYVGLIALLVVGMHATHLVANFS